MLKFLFNRIQTETKHGEIHLTDCEIQTLLCSVYPNIPYRKVITIYIISDTRSYKICFLNISCKDESLQLMFKKINNEKH